MTLSVPYCACYNILSTANHRTRYISWRLAHAYHSPHTSGSQVHSPLHPCSVHSSSTGTPQSSPGRYCSERKNQTHITSVQLTRSIHWHWKIQTEFRLALAHPLPFSLRTTFFHFHTIFKKLIDYLYRKNLVYALPLRKSWIRHCLFSKSKIISKGAAGQGIEVGFILTRYFSESTGGFHVKMYISKIINLVELL